MDSGLKAPFPWFGGKSRAARLILDGIGPIDNYVEPFAGSLAVLLNNPNPPKLETVNDLDRYIANVWRAVKAEPEAVAEHADWPVNEADLEARHYWLVTEGRSRLQAGMAHPEYYDAKIAGWWLWGISCWLGGRWCIGRGPWRATDGGWRKHRDGGVGITRRLPSLADTGRGINRRAVYANSAGDRKQALTEYLCQLAKRLRNVRVACGDWSRVVTPSVTFGLGVTGIVLDPPYGEGGMEYPVGGNHTDVAAKVREWAVANGGHPDLRIALCGYDGQHEMPSGWASIAWTGGNGYASLGGDGTPGKKNRHRERIWFSPHCPVSTRQVQPSPSGDRSMFL